MRVKGNHPMAELLAKKLFGIELVPKEEQKRMVNRAIKEAVKLYDSHLTDVEPDTTAVQQARSNSGAGQLDVRSTEQT